MYTAQDPLKLIVLAVIRAQILYRRPIAYEMFGKLK